jgi:hypothetical protein
VLLRELATRFGLPINTKQCKSDLYTIALASSQNTFDDDTAKQLSNDEEEDEEEDGDEDEEDDVAKDDTLYNHIHYNKYFDVIQYGGLLHETTNPLLMLRLLFNMLKPGGVLFVETNSILKSGKNVALVGQWNDGGDDGGSSSSSSSHRGTLPEPLLLRRWMLDIGFVDVSTTSSLLGRMIGPLPKDVHGQRLVGVGRKLRKEAVPLKNKQFTNSWPKHVC